MSDSAQRPWLVEPAVFAESTFDYLIIGGGTAGLTLASRLAEDSQCNVGVIEAGPYRPGDPMVEVPVNWFPAHENASYSWKMATTPQKHAHDRSISLPSGKGLGGTSAINLMAFMRASKRDYDNWEALGNKGWNWETLLPYFKKAETFYPQKPEVVFPGVEDSQQSMATESREKYHGTNGPLSVTYNETYNPLIHPGVKAMNSLGIATNYDPNLGDATGIFNLGTTVDRDTKKRSYSANAYLEAVRDECKLSVVTESQATRIIFSEESSIDQTAIRATGVEFVCNGTSFRCHAAKEVILSAGTYQTPQACMMMLSPARQLKSFQILELSGIGDAKLFSQYGIPCLIDLPQVGENHQDHLGVMNAFALKSNPPDDEDPSRTLSSFSFFPLKKVIPETTLAEMLRELDNTTLSAPFTPLQKAQFKLQRDSIDTNIGTGEVLFVGPLASFLSMFSAIQHPYSRGNVHIQSGDPLVPPKIDGHFFESPFDLAVLSKITKFCRTLALTEPLNSFVAGPALPPPSTESDEEYDDFVRKNFQTVFHPVGTSAMAPREIGGVVDASLRVYGTLNVRVVDASIIPLHIAAHPQATVYAIAERAADIIKGRI